MTRASRLSARLLVAIPVIASVLGVPCRASERQFPPGTPVEVISRRATKEAKALWRLDLGDVHVEEMTLLGESSLLVATKADSRGLPNADLLLVDTETGAVRWRYQRPGNADFEMLGVVSDRLIFQIEDAGSTRVLAVGKDSGARVWERDFSGTRRWTQLITDAGAILVAASAAENCDLTLMEAASGATLWSARTAMVKDALGSPPLVVGGSVWTFFGKLTRHSLGTGKPEQLAVDASVGSWPAHPVAHGGCLYLLDPARRLVALTLAEGKPIWESPLPEDLFPTSVFATEASIFVRARTLDDGHAVIALDRTTGVRRWLASRPDATVSNLIEHDGIVHVATPKALVALDSASGRAVYEREVSATGRAFPVHLLRFGDVVVFVGELVVAGFDAKSGRQIYRHGIDPLGEFAHLNGLDASIPQLEDEAKSIVRGGSETKSLLPYQMGELERYQALSTNFASEASRAYSRGDYFSQNIASMKASFARHNAQMAAMRQFASAAMSVSVVLLKMRDRLRVEATIDRQKLFRRSIVLAHIASEAGPWVFRPDRRFGDAQNDFVTGSVIHMPSGRRRETVLSPAYLAHGLWNAVDFERGIVYHAGLGLDPSAYEYGKARTVYPYGKIRPLRLQLVAVPMRVPPAELVPAKP